jgi:ADP-heptose:LPS heptosyltransferase
VVVSLRALGLGDLLCGLPALRAVAKAFPGHRTALLAPATLAPLVAASGAVDDLWPCSGRDDVRAVTGRPRVDVAVNLHGRGPESHRLLGRLSPRRLVGFDLPGAPRWHDDEHEVARWCRLLGESGILADPAQLELPAPASAPAGARGATVIHPGATSPARRWPPGRFAAVARAEAAAGRRVLVTGSAAERPLARRVAREAGLPVTDVVAGRLGVAQLAAVVACAGRVVVGDTGVAHLATALRTPSVVLFGPVSPCTWGPPADRPWHVALWAGRTGDPHGHRVDPGLMRIGVDSVLQALARLPEFAPAIPGEDAHDVHPT